ncbi:WD40 repeat domain-containing protein [Scytonema sp. NUACC26]|uniref:WD40 repeat domain-containing protein n=1 Tax=Scytonema sp. NUACC26 TaxID=3140176 RepID=UPI0034DC5FF6
MLQNINQPKDTDAILGSQTLPIHNSAVLGGIDDVLDRLTSSIIEQRIAALSEALLYGEDGLDLVIMCLNEEPEQVGQTAYLLLRNRTEPKVRQALREYGSYEFFECLGVIKADAHRVVISPDSKTIVSLGQKIIQFWDLKTLKYKFALKSNYDVFLLAFLDNKTILYHYNGLIRVWDLHLKWFKLSMWVAEYDVECLAISEHGNIAVCDSDMTIKIWNLNTGKCIRSIDDTADYLAITSDGKTFVSFNHSNGNIIKLWDIETGCCKHTIEMRSDCNSIYISPDGKNIVVDFGQFIEIWDIQTGRSKYTYQIEENQFHQATLTITPDGNTILIGCNDGTIELLDLETGEIFGSLKGHVASVNSIAISADKKFLVSSSDDNTIVIWGMQAKSYLP